VSDNALRLTYVGGPTVLLEWGGLRLLTDPTFDPAGTIYELPAYTLRKTQSPALETARVGAIDAVLLSHEHHFDNLDGAGRGLLADAARVLTTEDAVGRLGANGVGLAPWQSTELSSTEAKLTVTATPARHGPADGDRGPATGFALAFADAPGEVLYVSGDTVWFEGVAAVAERFDVRVAVLHLGAAVVREVGDRPLTLTAAEAVTVAQAMPSATIVPVHFEGWAHFSESREEIERAFRAAGAAARVRWLPPGEPTVLELRPA
jgi:L-ascorbate metabolism protein UlaG (beta-lactamase superfamily)